MLPRDSVLPIDSSFDVKFANEIAHLETYNKHHYRPNTYLHKWWGRRCGSTFRLILKGLIEDPERRSYYEPGGLEGKVILDPMIGGGTTLHEAIRMGASVIGVDVDPIPVLQARATLIACPLSTLRSEFEQFFEGLNRAVGELFQTRCPECGSQVPLQYALHGLRRKCSCREVLFVDSFTLRHEPDGGKLRWCPDCGELTPDGNHQCNPTELGLVEKTQRQCDRCGDSFRDVSDRPFYARYELLAVAGHCATHGLFHRSPDWRDRELQNQANVRRSNLTFSPEQFCVETGDKSIQLLKRNVLNYLDLFSSRQLAFLDATLRLLPDGDPAVRLNLALLVSTSLEFNSMLCGFKGVSKRRAGAVRHTFSHHGYSFPYTALENNPIYPRRASGTLRKLFYSRIVRGRQWAATPQERQLSGDGPQFVPIIGERDGGVEVREPGKLVESGNGFFLMQGSAVCLPIDTASVDAVVTDPPYYDSIQYGDLAAYFRVWLRQFLPDGADWNYNGETAAVNSERSSDSHQYVEMMAGIFKECRRVLKPGVGRLAFTFHHWQPRAWAALTIALYEAEFSLINRYVVHAEHPISVHINNMRALTHDAILVLGLRDSLRTLEWSLPDQVNRGDSYSFTGACANYLGWVLDQPNLSVGDIERLWSDAFRPMSASLVNSRPHGTRP